MLTTPKHLLKQMQTQTKISSINLTRFLNSLANKNTFKLNELVLARITTPSNRSQKKPFLKEKLIKLSADGILRTKTFEIFHQHIIGKSSNKNIFRIFPESAEPDNFIEIKRPTLYEYISNHQKHAVSSHFSILSTVPFLLELQKDSKILESGTGNASMTLFLSQILGMHADLHTYDIKPTAFAEKSYGDWKKNFEIVHDFEEKWFGNVKFFQGDIGEQAFDKSLEGYFDCFYFDLLNTDKAVENCYKLLKRNGVIVLNTMHLTQIMRTQRIIKNLKLKLETEAVLEPMHRFWRIASFDRVPHDELNFLCRIEDNIEDVKYLSNYWPGYLVKLRKKE